MKFRFITAATIILAPSAPTISAQSPAAREAATAVAAIEQSLVDAIARAEPSVVAISRTTPGHPTPAERRVGDVFGELRQAERTDAASAVVASGVIIDRAGLVLTQYLAVRENDQHAVTTIDGKTYAAKIRAADPRSGLAILAIDPTAWPLQRSGEPVKNAPGSFPSIRIADISNLRKGQLVIAIGNPFAIATDGQPTASWGIITNVARKAPAGTNLNDAPGPYKDFRTTLHHLGTLLQTDAKLGWSTGGGALVNLRGELVGLTTTAATIAGHEQSAGYAIPMSAAIRRVIDTLKQGREVEYGMLGVGFGPVPITSTSDPSRLRLSVTQVYPNGPAARAGLEGGDVLTRIGDQPVDDIDDVQLAIGTLPPGATTTIAYERTGQPATTSVTLAKLAVAGKTIATVRPESWRGMRVDYATTLEAPALTQAINSNAFDPAGCVLVTEVESNSIAWRAGVRPGMFVSHVAGKRVTTPNEFHAAVRNLGEKLDLQFTTPLSPETPAVNKSK
ncbi:MAG: PDZ domain-containing protein [Planctomycetes bacterium]|nr:PDZ domain-containing protein [Planctomycetota bacterium]